MKYFSEVLHKSFDTEKECLTAEKQYQAEQEKAAKLAEKRSADRKAAADKVEAARKIAIDANKAYREALNAFCKDYGPFHSTFSIGDIDDLFDCLFRF